MALFTTSDKTRFKKLKEDGCVVTLEVQIPAAKVREALQDALLQVQGQARVPGFRQGKAPLELVQKQFGGHAREKALDRLVREALPQALSEHRLEPVTPPSVLGVRLEEGKPLSFQLSVECAPQVEPKNYKKLVIARKAYPATDEEVARRIEELREGNARLEAALEDAVAGHHYVAADYQGHADGKPLPQMKGTDSLLDMSAPGLAEGLAQGLLGAKRGETREIETKLEGRPLLFRVTVKEIKVKRLPALDGEFAKDLGFASLEELKAKLREVIEQEGKARSERELMSQLQEALLKAHRFPVPPSLAQAELERMLERFRSQLLGPKRRLPEAEEAKLREKLAPRAEDEVRMAYLLRAIAEAEKLRVEEAEIDAERDRSLQAAESEEHKRGLERFFSERRDDAASMLLDRKTLAFLRDNAAISDPAR